MNLKICAVSVVLVLSGCSPSEDTNKTKSEMAMAIIGQQEASELLLDAIDNYRDRPFQELVLEVGIGDDYYMISEGDDGSKESYSISIENEWYTEAQDKLLIKATIYGPSPKEGGVVPELQSESVVVERY